MQGRCGEALQIYKTAERSDPHVSEIHFLIGYSNHCLGNVTQAKEEYLLQLAITPYHAKALLKLGAVELDEGHSSLAREYLKRVLAREPEEATANYLLGRLYMTLKAYDRAIPPFQRVVRQLPNNPSIHYRLYTAYSRLGKTELAKAEFEVYQRLIEGVAGKPLGNVDQEPELGVAKPAEALTPRLLIDKRKQNDIFWHIH